MTVELTLRTAPSGRPATPADASRFRSIELFSGAGGLAIATHRAGFRHAALVELDEEACETLKSNISSLSEPGIGTWNVRGEDVRQVSYGEYSGLDLLAGGAACQPFSIAGAHQGRQDQRNLLPEFIRAVRETSPRAFLLENVDGLMRPSFASYFEYVRHQLAHPTHQRRPGEKWKTHHTRLKALRRRSDDIVYDVMYAQLNAADFGVPQLRKRVFVIGLRSDLRATFHFPIATHSLDRLLYDQWVSRSYWDRYELRHPLREATFKWRRRIDQLRKVQPFGEPWQTVRDAISGLPQPNATPTSEYSQHILRQGAKPYTGHTGSDLDWPSKTIKAGDHGVPGGENMLRGLDGNVRYYTVREMARLQTFPDAWTFQGKWNAVTKQLGNAVPPKLGKVVADAVAEALGRKISP